MRRTQLLRAAMLVLALLLLLGGISGAAWADSADDSAAVGWSVSAKDGDGSDVTTSSAEEIGEKLGDGFALSFGRDSSITAPTAADLRRGGVTITPPEGYTVSSAFLVAEGGEIPSDSRSLLTLAVPALDGSNAVALPAAIFAEGFDASSVGSVFNGSGDSYTLRIALERVAPAEQITLSYTPGALASSLGDTALVPGGNTAVFPISGGSASGRIAVPDTAAADTALRSFGKQFTGWKLLLANGASALLEGGESFALSSSATLEAQWKDVIVFAFTGGEKLYDGTPLTGSYTQTGSVLDGDELTIPDEAFTLSRTDAGESTATLDISRVCVTRGGTDVTDEYEFAVIPATLRVVQRGVTFAVANVSCEYDGTAHSPSSYTLSSGELVEGHSASAAYSGQQTLPGSSTGSAAFTILDGSGSDVTANYNVSVINGSISVTTRSEKQPLTVTIRDVEKEYDGSADVTADYTLSSGSLLGSDRLAAASFSGNVADVGTGSIEGSFAVYNGETDVSENYAITVVPGKLTVKPRPIVLTADSAEKDFDGKPLTKDSFTLTSGTLMAGHTVSATVAGSQTEAGSSPNKIASSSVTVTDKDGNNVTGLYSFRLADGTLTVKGVAAPTAITVTMKSAEKVYDGTALTSKEYSITSGALAEGDKLVIGKVTGEQTDVGLCSVTASFTVKHGENDVTAKYAITVVPGKLTVKPRPIVLTADFAEKDFDGKPLTKDSFTLTSGTLMTGHTVSATVTGSQTEAGSSPNKIVSSSVTVTDKDGKNVTGLYSIRLADGTLTVKSVAAPTAITVTMKNAEKFYDGTALTSKEYSITSGALADGDTLVIGKVTGEQTDVGLCSVTASFTVKHGENDVTAKYAITVVPGKLTVKPRPIVLTADSAEKDFDGKPLTKDSFTLTSGTLMAGHTVSATVAGSQTEAGSSPNKIGPSSVSVTDKDGKNVTGLYSIRLVDGTLTVKSVAALTAITVTMKSAEKVYDGTALTSEEYSITSGALAEGDKLVIGKVTGEQTDAGSSSVTAPFTVMHGKNDVTAKYAITVVPGKLTVKERPITVTAGSASKIYDGRALTSSSYQISSGELVKGHKLTASVTGSQTELGSSANMIVKSSLKITDGSGKDVTENYSITTAAGTLSVSRDPVTAITLTVGDGSQVYDGKPHRFIAADIRVSSGSLPNGYRIEATFNPEAPVDVGKYDVTIKSVTIRNASGADVTNQFNISRVKGSYTITARPLTIETKAANKVYDGTALTERSTPTINGRVEGHQVTLRITGSQTKVGSSENTVADVKITDKESGADVTKNYAISYQYGLLTVSEGTEGSAEAGSYSWVNGSAGTLYIRFDHDYEGFEGLQVDGKDLDRSAYTSTAGSTDIWLKSSYLNTLSSGAHTLTAKYAGGESVNTSFSVEAQQSARSAGGSGRLVLWLVILATAFLGFLVAVWYLLLGKDLRWKRRSGRN